MLCPVIPASVRTSVSTSGDSVTVPLAVRCGSIGTRTALTRRPATIGKSGTGSLAVKARTIYRLVDLGKMPVRMVDGRRVGSGGFLPRQALVRGKQRLAPTAIERGMRPARTYRRRG